MAECEKALETYPGNPFILYNVACLENLLGRPDDALATLGDRDRGAGRSTRSNAREDEDFASLREDPRFTALVRVAGCR